MGHLLSLTLPQSKAWGDVVAAIGEGETASGVTGLASIAAGRALKVASDDPAFQATAQALVELPLAARGPGFLDFLRERGLSEEDLASRSAFLAALTASLDRKDATTDLGEIARIELVRALTVEFDTRLPSLFLETPADVRKALGDLAGGKNFARFARRLFAGLTQQSLSYYLSRALASQTGDGERFQSDADRVDFEEAVARHAWDTARCAYR